MLFSGNIFYEIALLLALAGVFGVLGLLLRQPLIIAFLAVGILVGPAALGLVSASDQIDLLAKLGIALLLFIVGLKLDLHLIRTIGPVAIYTGLGQIIFTSVFGYLISLLLGMTAIEALYLSVALTFSSTIIIVKLLSDKREIDSLHGRIAVGFLIVQDIAVPQALTGREIEEMDDDALFTQVKTVSVYARVAPHHKLRIAQQLMRHGEIVAMTGDGVNDAPALKAAHIGVAMGRTGTDVAKEASDMVITDDNFATIFAAVEEGRIVFDNIRKVVFFLIPTGVAAILSIIATIALGLPMPYTPSQLLWINLVTNGLQVLALTFEPGERGVILRPPRDPREGVMSKVLVQRTVIVGVLIAAGVVYNYVHALELGEHLEQARTVAVTTMVFFQFFQTWNSRSESMSVFRMSPLSNPLLFFAIVASVLAQLAVIYAPGLSWIFQTEPLTVAEWARIIVMSLSVILVVEIDKWLRRRSGRREGSRAIGI